jgi:MFS transporter, DHA1 family, inner membrane transport protein
MAKKDRPRSTGAPDPVRPTAGESEGGVWRQGGAKGAGDTRAVSALVVASFLGALTGISLGPFLAPIARDLGTSVPLLGQTVTASLLCAAVLGLAVGPLADRYGRRPLLLAGLAGVALCGGATAAARGYPGLLGGQVLGSLGVAALEGVALAEAGARFSGAARRRAMGAITGAIASSSVVGVPLLAAVGGAAGWRSAFLVLCAAGLAGAFAVALTLPRDDPAAARASGVRGGVRGGVRALLGSYAPLARHRRAQALLGSSSLRAVFWMGAILYLGALFSERFGLATTEVGLVYLASGVGYLAGSAAAGSRLGGADPRVLNATTTVGCGLLFGLAFAAPFGPVFSAGCAAAASFLAPFGWVSLAAMLSEETPAGQGTTMVLAVSVYSLGAAVGGAVGGLLLAVGGYPALGLGLPAFALAAAALAAARRSPTRL